MFGGEFSESSVISQTKPSKLVVIIITLWLNLFIRQTFPRQTLKKSKFAKVSCCQTFLLYNTSDYQDGSAYGEYYHNTTVLSLTTDIIMV